MLNDKYQMSNTTDVKVGVLGLGREGLDLLYFLNKIKIRPVGLDSKTARGFGKNYSEIKKLTSKLYLSNDYLKYLDEFDIIFRSPGVPLDLAEIKQAKKKGIVFSSLTQLFFDLCPAKIIGVTGTKGKSTTAALIHHILKHKVGGKVYFGGNIGFPPLSLLTKLTPRDVVILELSSFQLEDLTASPNIAVILDITPEHLDRHKTFKEYLKAKFNILLHQKKNDYLISSVDHPITRIVLKQAPGKIFKYSLKQILPQGVYLSNDKIVTHDIKTNKCQTVMLRTEVPLWGSHNLENLLAAISTALLMKVSITDIRKRIKSFKSLEHRLELVGMIGKVRFINDSMATTPIAAIASIRSIKGPLSLILGGVSKGESLKELIQVLKLKRIKGIVLIGQMANKLMHYLKIHKVNAPRIKVNNLEAAVEIAYSHISDEGSVVLAPAFASFDMFKDAYDRGHQFKKVVKSFIKKRVKL